MCSYLLVSQLLQEGGQKGQRHAAAHHRRLTAVGIQGESGSSKAAARKQQGSTLDSSPALKYHQQRARDGLEQVSIGDLEFWEAPQEARHQGFHGPSQTVAAALPLLPSS